MIILGGRIKKNLFDIKDQPVEFEKLRFERIVAFDPAAAAAGDVDRSGVIGMVDFDELLQPLVVTIPVGVGLFPVPVSLQELRAFPVKDMETVQIAQFEPTRRS